MRHKVAPPESRAVILTPSEVADWRKVSVAQVARLGIPAIHCGTRKAKRYRQQDVERWITEQVNGRAR